MFVATIAVTALLAALLAYSAIRKLSHDEPVVQSYERVGVPEERLNLLAMILLAGAAGLVLGLFRAPIGIATAAALIGYFPVAIGFHIRAGDAKNLPTPVVLAAMAVAALLLRLATT